jgi:hypothetical protein
VADLSLARKLSEVMGEVGWIPKKGKNTFQNYDYVREVDIVDAVREKLAARQVALIPKVVHLDYQPMTTAKGVAGFFAVVTMSYTFVDGESGESLVVEAVGAGTDQPGDKAFYKAQTGAKKYALTQAFLIATGDDPEDEQAPKKAKAPAKPEPRQTPQNRPQAAQPPEDEGQAPLVPITADEASAKLRRIRIVRQAKQDHKTDPRVADNSISQMTIEELEREFPEIAKAID